MQRDIKELPPQKTCDKCNGCGKIANSKDGEPWTEWANLPPGSDVAVKMGLVKPIECPQCYGRKTVDEWQGKPFTQR